MLDPTYKAYCGPIQCKDFITDAFWSEHMRKPLEVYGFKWSPPRMSLDDPWYYLGLRHSQEPLLGKYAGSTQEFVREFDEALGFKRTCVESANDGAALLVKYSKAW